MIILVMGANGSGKSRWAEQIATKLQQGRLVYIATMIPFGQDGLQRVARHREQRREAGFITLELPLAISRAELCPNDTVLLEDVSNLAANMLFNGVEEVDVAAVMQEIRTVSTRCCNLILVSISGLQLQEAYDTATNHYIEFLAQVNTGLWDLADLVYEMEQGQALLHKGVQPWEY